MMIIQSLSKTYNTTPSPVRALHNIHLTVGAGEWVAIMGTSGSGKSTLLHILGFLDRPTTGEYHFQGIPTSHLHVEERALLRRKAVGFVFQTSYLLPYLSALQNVELGLHYLNISKQDTEARSLEALRQVGMDHRVNHTPSQLSGGEQQRVSIARAIAKRPDLILLDEPTGNLDSHNRTEILAILHELNREGHTLVMVTHDPIVSQTAMRTISIQDGEIVPSETAAKANKK